MPWQPETGTLAQEQHYFIGHKGENQYIRREKSKGFNKTKNEKTKKTKTTTTTKYTRTNVYISNQN